MKKYKAVEIANWYIRKFAESGDLVTHLKIQKLLYYSEAWNQVKNDLELFDEQIEAWAHGPVVRAVFQEFKESGWNPLPIPNEAPDISADTIELLNEIIETYGVIDAKTLERMTHEDEPWICARGNLASEAPCNTEISKDEIKKYFKKKYEM